MHFFFRYALFGLFLVATLPAVAQNALFEPYDCRPEMEIMAFIERQRVQRELAILDSIERIIQQHALLMQEEERKLREDTLGGWKHWTIIENFAFGKNRGGMPMITDLSALHPFFRDRVIALIHRCKSKGIELSVVETYRTHAKQAEYKNMGRQYTRNGAGKSRHQFGLAVDVVPIVNGKAQWHNRYLWRRIGLIGEQLGLQWGGRWRSLYDPGHFEWTGGLSSEELAEGKKPVVPMQDVNYPCMQDDLRTLSRYWVNWENEQSALATNQQ